jgi:para-aminobenzoate synthetase
VIRTIVIRAGGNGNTTIGAGGAIVTQSDPAEEFDELLLKARAPMAAIARAVTGSDSPDAWTVEVEPTFTPTGAP